MCSFAGAALLSLIPTNGELSSAAPIFVTNHITLKHMFIDRKLERNKIPFDMICSQILNCSFICLLIKNSSTNCILDKILLQPRQCV